MAPWAPPFKVACRICYQIEGKLKNYKNDRFYIKAYECLTGYQFEEVPYLNHFCPSCACILKKLFRFKKQCRLAHYWLMDYMNSGRKISQPYIRRMQEYRLKSRPVQLKVWRSESQTVVNCVYATKRYKPKPKVVYDIGVSHLSVPKNPAEETWHFRATPKDPFWSDYGTSDEEQFNDEERISMAKDYLHAEQYNLPYEDRIGTLNVRVSAPVAQPVEGAGGESARGAPGSNPAMTSQPIPKMAGNTAYSELLALKVESSGIKRNSGYIDTQPQPTTSNSDVQFKVDRTGGDSSIVGPGSNPAMTSQPVRPMGRIATYSEIEASKSNSGYIDYQPQPSTSNSDIRQIYERNQLLRPTSTPLPVTKEGNVQKQNTQPILKPQEGLYRYQCRFCLLRFTEQNSLDAHIKLHQGPSPQTPHRSQAVNATLMCRTVSTSHK